MVGKEKLVAALATLFCACMSKKSTNKLYMMLVRFSVSDRKYYFTVVIWPDQI